LNEYFPKNEVEFDSRFSSEKSCLDSPSQLRWPEGFRCFRCGHTEYWAKECYFCGSGLRCSGGFQQVNPVSMLRSSKISWGWAVIKRHGAGSKSCGLALCEQYHSEINIDLDL
jgi:hypothetical protein